ncbi:hypothetical protein F511_23280 [Dorcoceras hygrometricum]|uniref:Uncharacterized protein n=1 Tax=Dorcoceras hygrometricum TaxID=472368 RepID=A0A2Z7BN87_9LAMI|nr:hypothetical protein F511_23280 [Dorcoceras hygrometricum]
MAQKTTIVVSEHWFERVEPDPSAVGCPVRGEVEYQLTGTLTPKCWPLGCSVSLPRVTPHRARQGVPNKGTLTAHRECVEESHVLGTPCPVPTLCT